MSKLSEGAVARLQAGETSSDPVVLQVRSNAHQELRPPPHLRPRSYQASCGPVQISELAARDAGRYACSLSDGVGSINGLVTTAVSPCFLKACEWLT